MFHSVTLDHQSDVSDNHDWNHGSPKVVERRLGVPRQKGGWVANVGQYLAYPDHVHGLRLYSHCFGTSVHEKPKAFQYLNLPCVLQPFTSHP